MKTHQLWKGNGVTIKTTNCALLCSVTRLSWNPWCDGISSNTMRYLWLELGDLVFLSNVVIELLIHIHHGDRFSCVHLGLHVHLLQITQCSPLQVLITHCFVLQFSVGQVSELCWNTTAVALIIKGGNNMSCAKFHYIFVQAEQCKLVVMLVNSCFCTTPSKM